MIYLVTDTVAGSTIKAKSRREAQVAIEFIVDHDADIDNLLIALYSGTLPIIDGHNGVHIGYMKEV